MANIPRFSPGETLRPGSVAVADDGTPWEVTERCELKPARIVVEQSKADAGEAPLKQAFTKTFTAQEVDAIVDQDRIRGFLMFAGQLDPAKPSLVYGTSAQAISIARALTKAGYTAG